MTSEEIIEKIKSSCGEDIEKVEVTLGDAVVHIHPQSLHKVAGFLKDDPDLGFNYLSHITGVDYLDMDRDPRFEAVYELHSIDHNHSVRVRVGLPEENPALSTVSDLWPSAVFPERELIDLFGFDVSGIENPRRLIMPEDWEGHPLRRDYSIGYEDVTFSHNRDFKSELVKSKPPTL